MKREHLERLRRLEGAAAWDADDMLRERLHELGKGPDPFDAGEAIVIEAIFGESE